MEKFQEALESNKELIDVLRFLIQDQAFHIEFLVTTILEYLANNPDCSFGERKKGG